MQILSALAAVWMAFMSLFGFLHHGASAGISEEGGSTPQVQQTQQLPPSEAQDTRNAAQQPSQNSSSQSSSVAENSSATVTLPATGSSWLSALPLGDGKYTTSAPKDGYVYLCNVASGGEGAEGTPPWISGDVWYPAQKIAVEGSVSWPDAYYSMTISGSERIIKSNGEPTDHPTGIFPIASSDPAYQFDRNPNSIEPQSWDYTLPVTPVMLPEPDCIYGEVGIMNDGVPLFDGFDATYRDAVAHELQDAWEGHPNESNVYHDHGFETGPVKDPVSTVVGFAFDGYPITGSLLPDGTYLHTADLDECHGLISTITLDGKSVTTYHYVLTQDFPYSVSCFRGESYEPKPPQANAGASTNANQQSQSAGGSPPAPPQGAIDACSGKSSGASCTVGGGPSGTCTEVGGSLACKPE